MKSDPGMSSAPERSLQNGHAIDAYQASFKLFWMNPHSTILAAKAMQTAAGEKEARYVGRQPATGFRVRLTAKVISCKVHRLRWATSKVPASSSTHRQAGQARINSLIGSPKGRIGIGRPP